VVIDAACNGSNTGAVDITVSGGTPGYTFLWTGGAITEDLTAITAGTYAVIVTDTNSCTKVDSFVVKETNLLFASVSISDPVCKGGNTGFILIDATGGFSPYTYSWNTPLPNSGPTATNLAAGIYNVTVSDAHNCSATVTAELTDPEEIVVTANTQGANCFNTTAVVNATATGGLPPYTFLLNGVAQTTGIFPSLPEGSYLLLAMDVNGCQGSISFNLGAPADINISLGATQQVILTGMETQLIVTTDSGATILHYSWSPDSLFAVNSCSDCPNPFVAPRTTTIFTVTAMTSDSCYLSDTITIYVDSDASRFVPTAFTPNGDGLNDRFEIDVLGATNLEVAIYNRWGQQVFFNENQVNGTQSGSGWDGTIDGKPAPLDTYTYQIRATYWDNVTKHFAGTVTLMK
jgi:gliding motility-associated-like protein